MEEGEATRRVLTIQQSRSRPSRSGTASEELATGQRGRRSKTDRFLDESRPELVALASTREARSAIRCHRQLVVDCCVAEEDEAGKVDLAGRGNLRIYRSTSQRNISRWEKVLTERQTPLTRRRARYIPLGDSTGKPVAS